MNDMSCAPKRNVSEGVLIDVAVNVFTQNFKTLIVASKKWLEIHKIFYKVGSIILPSFAPSPLFSPTGKINIGDVENINK